MSIKYSNQTSHITILHLDLFYDLKTNLVISIFADSCPDYNGQIFSSKYAVDLTKVWDTYTLNMKSLLLKSLWTNFAYIDFVWIHLTWYIGGSKGGARDTRPPGGPNSFIFMQFSGKK